MQYAMLILHDECIKKYPPQGALLRSTRHSAEELVNTPISTPLGNNTAAGKKVTLAGEKPPLHPIRPGNRWGIRTTNALCGETTVFDLLGEKNQPRTPPLGK